MTFRVVNFTSCLRKSFVSPRDERSADLISKRILQSDPSSHGFLGHDPPRCYVLFVNANQVSPLTFFPALQYFQPLTIEAMMSISTSGKGT
jgi:hypothetical protein